MKDEVEDFLRRVAQMRAQAEAQAKGQPARPAQPTTPPPPKQPRPPKQLPRLVPQQTEPAVVQPDVVDAELSERSDRVSRRVADDMRGTEQIAEHTKRLGQEVDAVDEKLEAHLHQVFDHQLGRLKKTATDTAAPAHERPTAELTSAQIIQMLRSPTSIRDAIIMAEVLRRPEW
jgi:hypothetical protein